MRRLSKLQRLVVLTGSVLIGLSLLFPCWVINGQYGFNVYYLPYHFLFDMPYDATYYDIDLPRLVSQVAIIIVVTVGFTVALPSQKNPN